jgi:uncharacterized coiled-coil protein SlyX
MADQQTNLTLSDVSVNNVAFVLGNLNVTLKELKASVETLSAKIDRLTEQLGKQSSES